MRRADQTVQGFSVPKSMLHDARVKAAELDMTISGFVRYCLAKGMNYSEEEAKKFAKHGAIARLQNQVRYDRPIPPTPNLLNDRPK